MNETNRVILVVDDEPEIGGMLVDCLEVHGYLMLSARNADEALRLLDLHPETGLLLTDVVMPGGMNGFDLARRAQSVNPRLQVVFMTGYAAAEMIGDAMKRRPTILQKPFWFEHLIRVVEAAFATRSPGSIEPSPPVVRSHPQRVEDPCL